MHAFIQDVPIDALLYRQIVEGLGDDPPPGLVVHIAAERSEGGLRYYSVWESAEHFERFAEERLHPVVHRLLSEVFGDDFPPEPEQQPFPVIHAWGRLG